MNILMQRFNPKAGLNRLWREVVRGTWVAKHVQHQAQMRAAIGLQRMIERCPQLFPSRDLLAQGMLGMPLRGAGYGWESQFPLIPDPSGTSPVVTTGANALDFNVMQNVTVLIIGFAWQVAGTVTALVADFDKTSGPGNTGTATDKLDGTNGTITAPTVAGQAIGNVLYKNLGDTLDIDLTVGNCVHFNVTTTTTAGSGIPFVLVVPRAEVPANITTMIASS